MAFEGLMNTPEAAPNPAEIIANDPLLHTDALSQRMIENDFTGPDGKAVEDPIRWIEERRAILEQGIPQIDPAAVAEGGVVHSNPAERKLSEEAGIPDKPRKEA